MAKKTELMDKAEDVADQVRIIDYHFTRV